MGSRVFGHVGDPDIGQHEERKAPHFTQDEVDYLKAMFPIDLSGTAASMDEALAVSHLCAKADGIESVIRHMQAVIDSRKAPQ